MFMAPMLRSYLLSWFGLGTPPAHLLSPFGPEAEQISHRPHEQWIHIIALVES